MRLAEIGILLGIVQRIVALDGGEEGLLGVAGEAQLVGQLLDGVGLEEAAFRFCVLHLLLDIVLACVAGLCGAADGVEALDVFQNVGIADLAYTRPGWWAAA